MIEQFDALALANKVEFESQSGKLTRELLTQGQTLYGKNLDYLDHLERIMPDGKRSLGYWRNGKFEEVISLL